MYGAHADKITGHGEAKGAARGCGGVRFEGVEAGWGCWEALDAVPACTGLTMITTTAGHNPAS